MARKKTAAQIAAEDAENRMVLTTQKVEEIRKKNEQGLKLHRGEKYWFMGEQDVRKANLTFAMTREEIAEWVKCSESVQYFAEKYCKIKREDGTIGEIKLRDYQKDIIDLYTQNRFAILMSSRQMGKCVDFNTVVTLKKHGKKFKKTLGELYYDIVKTHRPLTIAEKAKNGLYKVLRLIN